MAPQSPYDTVAAFGKPFSDQLPEGAADDRKRLRAYDTYDDMFHNTPDIWVTVMNVDGDNELFRRLVPSARSIVEATNRYLARGLEWVGTMMAAGTATESGGGAPATGQATGGAAPDNMALAMGQLKSLMDREEFAAKFLSLKRWYLVRGDGMLHITADISKPEGTRISVTELEARTYFAIPDPANAERVLGCYIVNTIKNDEDEDIVARLEYHRVLTPEQAAELPGSAVGGVYQRMTFWEPDGWDARYLEETDLKPVPPPARFAGPTFAPLLAGVMLAPQITAIPVYHFRNRRRGGQLFGLSELQGIETLITGVNQTTTDQELAVALQGLGFYWTDAFGAQDSDGNPVEYVVAPGSVAEVPKGSTFGRVQGVNTIIPSQEHANQLKREMQETSGTPRIAMGGMDAANPASGVALAIEMAPMVAKNEEKEEEFVSKLTQMLFDLLTGWLPAIEGQADLGVRVVPVFEDPIPVNREATLTELVQLVTTKIISAKTAREFAALKLGYQFPADEEARVAAEAQLAADAMGARMDQELAGGAAPAAEEVSGGSAFGA